MLTVFSLIFAVDTKIILNYNFGAPLKRFCLTVLEIFTELFYSSEITNNVVLN